MISIEEIEDSVPSENATSPPPQADDQSTTDTTAEPSVSGAGQLSPEEEEVLVSILLYQLK